MLRALLILPDVGRSGDWGSEAHKRTEREEAGEGFYTSVRASENNYFYESGAQKKTKSLAGDRNAQRQKGRNFTARCEVRDVEREDEEWHGEVEGISQRNGWN